MKRNRKWLAVVLAAIMAVSSISVTVSAENADSLLTTFSQKTAETGDSIQESLESGEMSDAHPDPTTAGTTAENPIAVPEQGMVIKSGVYYGVSKEWYEKQNFEKKPVYFSITVPRNVTAIAKDGFRDSYSSEKDNVGAITNYDGSGQYTDKYKVVEIDFSQATSLTTINNQAAMGCAISGTLDLSNTKVETIGKSAFSGCTNLTGVILPDTLKILGESDGAAGSVFNSCSGLQFVRTVGGDPDAVFELPQGLEVIGKQCFKDTFKNAVNMVLKIPASVKTVGSEAFYNTDQRKDRFSQIIIEREAEYEGYNTGAFKYVGMVIFPSSDSYKSIDPLTRTEKTYPVTLQFMNGSDIVTEQLKLYGQSIQYTQGQDGFWDIDSEYSLPDPGAVGNIPGYDAGWKIYGDTKVLTSSSKVNGWTDDKLKVEIVNDAVVSKPTVEYTVNGNVVEKNNGVQALTVEVSDTQSGSVGVQVTHPLATEEAQASGTYVYFKYCWWDEMDNGVNGPRSQEQPEIFSTADSSSQYKRVFTDLDSIEIRDVTDARSDGNYYLVEVYGYYVKDNGSPKQFYKSNHNFIAGQDGNAGESFLMEVTVTETSDSGNQGGTGGGSSAGCAAQGQWMWDGIGWWWQNNDGTWPTSQWRYLPSGKGYYAWYWFNQNGYITYRWQNIGANWYYMNNSGERQTGWIYANERWYYLNGEGKMLTGWIQDSQTQAWYYMNPNQGDMHFGWLHWAGYWYYFDRHGAMVTGWQNIGEKWYYFYPENGRMAANTLTPDGYSVDEQGAWMG
ncbi:MAG: leucine-rich repeat protein [Massiliimalia sp.]|jgi:glucan-binding YG repeat protein